MDRKIVIQRAKEVFAEDRVYAAMLKREGFVRIAVPVDAPHHPTVSVPSIVDGPPVVTFTEENNGVFGLRLMAEYQGVKEFAA